MEDKTPPKWSSLERSAIAVTWMLVAAVWKGFVLSKLWIWFVVPIFGLKALTLAEAIGVSLILTLCFLTPLATPDPLTEELAKQRAATISEDSKKQWGTRAVDMLLDPGQVTNSIGTPLIYLLMGWLLKHFV